MELEKLNKEKTLLIDGMSFKIANNEEKIWYTAPETRNSCQETDQIKRDFTHLSYKYIELLLELLKTQSSLKDQSIHEKANFPCNHCSSEFTNEQNINIHNKKCHKVKFKLCNFTFKSAKKLQKT